MSVIKLTAAHRQVAEKLRVYDGASLPDNGALAIALEMPPDRLATIMGDLSDKGRIKIEKSRGKATGRSIMVYAWPDDDTDEISRRIQAKTPAPSQRAPEFKPPATPPPPPPATYPKPLGMPPSIEMRHPDELRIDDSYQRSIDTGPSRALIDKIAKAWDWRMCLPLVVSKRDDGFYVIDGQHRHGCAATFPTCRAASRFTATWPRRLPCSWR